MIEIVAGVILTGVVVAFWKLTSDARKPLQYRSPDPLEVPVNDLLICQSMSRVLNQSNSGAHQWKVTDSVEPSYITAELDYTDLQNPHIKCDLTLQFDFEALSETETRIRWFGQYKHWCDKSTAATAEAATNLWIRNAVAMAVHPVHVENTPAIAFQIRKDKDAKRIVVTQSCAISFAKISSKATGNITLSRVYEMSMVKQQPERYLLLKVIHKVTRAVSMLVNISLASADSEKTEISWSCTVDPQFDENAVEDAEELVHHWITECVVPSDPILHD